MNSPRKVLKVALCSLISDNVTHAQHEMVCSPTAIILGAQLDGMKISIIIEDEDDFEPIGKTVGVGCLVRTFVFIRPNMQVPYNGKFVHLIQAAQLNGFLAVYELIDPIKYEMPIPGERHSV